MKNWGGGMCVTWWGSAPVRGAGEALSKGQGKVCGLGKFLAGGGCKEVDAGEIGPPTNALLCETHSAGSGEQPTPLLPVPVPQVAETPQCKYLEENVGFSLCVWNYIRMRERVTPCPWL